MRYPRPIVEMEVTDRPPDNPDADKLVRKHGKVCLRCRDTIIARKDGKLVVTRTWQPQGRHPFSTDFYEWSDRPKARQ